MPLLSIKKYITGFTRPFKKPEDALEPDLINSHTGSKKLMLLIYFSSVLNQDQTSFDDKIILFAGTANDKLLNTIQSQLLNPGHLPYIILSYLAKVTESVFVKLKKPDHDFLTSEEVKIRNRLIDISRNITLGIIQVLMFPALILSKIFEGPDFSNLKKHGLLDGAFYVLTSPFWVVGRLVSLIFADELSRKVVFPFFKGLFQGITWNLTGSYEDFKNANYFGKFIAVILSPIWMAKNIIKAIVNGPSFPDKANLAEKILFSVLSPISFICKIAFWTVAKTFTTGPKSLSRGDWFDFEGSSVIFTKGSPWYEVTPRIITSYIAVITLLPVVFRIGKIIGTAIGDLCSGIYDKVKKAFSSPTKTAGKQTTEVVSKLGGRRPNLTPMVASPEDEHNHGDSLKQDKVVSVVQERANRSNTVTSTDSESSVGLDPRSPSPHQDEQAPSPSSLSLTQSNP